MKAYKLEILIIDLDEVGKDEIVSILENARYPNDCISPKIKSVEEADIGEWHDSHPLNKRTSCNEEYKRLFGPK